MGNVFEYKLTAGGGIAINANNVLSTDVQLGDYATSAVIYTASGYKWGVRVDDSVNDVSYYLRGTPSNLTFATRTPAAPSSGTMTNDWTLTLPLKAVELGQVTGTADSISLWRGWDNATFGDYMGIGAQKADGTDGFRMYFGQDALRFRTYVGTTGSDDAWWMYPDELSPYQNVEDVTETACYAYGYTSATSGQAYFDIELSRRIRTGKTVTISAITASIRGTTGIMKSNASNILSNVSSIAVAPSGKLRVTLVNLTTAFTANTPVHMYVNSITFSVSS